MKLPIKYLSYIPICSWGFLLLAILLCPIDSFAQDKAINILQNRLKSSSISADSSANIYRKLTRLHAKQRRPNEALEMAQKEALLRQQHPSYKLGEVYFNMASLYRALAAYDKALSFAHKALKIYQAEFGEQHIEVLSVYTFLAQTHYFKEDYPQAIGLSQMAIEGYAKQSTRIPSAEINLQLLLGSLQLKTAAYPQALTAFLKAKQIYFTYEKKVSIELLARTYNNLASLKLEQQATLEALAYYQKIVAIRKKLHHENHYTLQKTYTNIGLCYYQLLEPQKALVYHRKSLAILYKTHGEKHDLVAFSHNHIGAIYQRIGQEDSAQYHLNKAITIYRNIFGKSSPKSIAPLWRLAKLFRQQKDYSKAEVTLKKAILIQQLHFADDHPDLIKMYLNMAYLFQDQALYAKAGFYANKAYHLKLRNKQPLDKTLMLGILEAQLSISLHLSQKERYKAFVLLDKIQSLVALAQMDLNYTTDRQNLSSSLRKVCERGIELCYQLYQKSKQAVYINKAFQLMELNKAVLLSMQIKQERWNFGLADSSQQQQKKLLTEVQFLEQQWKKSEYDKDSIKAQVLQQQLFDLHRTYEKQISKNNQQLHYHRPIDLPTLQKQLIPQQVIINYFYGQQGLYLFIITKQEVQLLQLNLDFEHQLKQFSSCLLDLEKSKTNLAATCQEYDQAAFAVHQKLLPNIRGKQIVLVTDGQLGYIPFEALTTKPNPSAKGYHQLHYALHRYTIAYAYSATSYYYQQFKHLNHRDAQILAFAPDYQQDPLLPSLASNIPEVQFLEQHFAGAFYYNKQASKAKFEQQSANFSILHLSTHAYADHHKMQQAQLFFAYDGSDSLAYILQPYEIAQLSFQADFVVLSACQTAIGYWQKGEGIMSLARDFMYAGVPSILTTLWQINDKSSGLIVQDFYKHLKSLPKDKALQLAKQNYLKQASAFAAHPYFWSSFILLGNSNRLDIDAAASIKIWYIVGVFIILFFFIRKHKRFRSST